MQVIKQEKGAVMLFFILFFVVASSALTFLMSRSMVSDLLLVSSLNSSKQAYLTAESGLEDIIFRVSSGQSVDSTVILDDLPGVATTTVVYDVSNDTYEVTATSKLGRTTKIDTVTLMVGDGTSFNYGLQTGNGGFDLSNSASITGNVFSNGDVSGQGSSVVRGDVISAGPLGLISGIHATGSVRANTLDNSLVEGDAYYNSIGSPSTVNGTRYIPYTVDDPELLPVTDEKIEEWKTSIIDTGTVIPISSCTAGQYLIDSTTSIGNVKIECDLVIEKTGGSTIVTLTGPIWVVGNISFSKGPTIRIDSGVGNKSVQMIADNQADLLTSSKINIENSTLFEGSGQASSFIMLISQNNSNENGGTETAISIGQSSSGELVLYAGHGKIVVSNQAQLKSLTGYRIEVGNSANITYETGLSSIFFTGGPGGSYVVSDWYQE